MYYKRIVHCTYVVCLLTLKKTITWMFPALLWTVSPVGTSLPRDCEHCRGWPTSHFLDVTNTAGRCYMLAESPGNHKVWVTFSTYTRSHMDKITCSWGLNVSTRLSHIHQQLSLLQLTTWSAFGQMKKWCSGDITKLVPWNDHNIIHPLKLKQKRPPKPYNSLS